MENNQHILNSINLSSQATRIAKLENDLQNWKIPEEPFKKIYHLGNFSFITCHNIKTCESTIAINNYLEIIRLIKDSDINHYRTDFNLIHTILYRVFYRLMKTTLAPKARVECQKGVTMLMEANHEHSTIFVPRLLRWNDILSNNDWRYDAIT